MSSSRFFKIKPASSCKSGAVAEAVRLLWSTVTKENEHLQSVRCHAVFVSFKAEAMYKFGNVRDIDLQLTIHIEPASTYSTTVRPLRMHHE